MNKKVFSKTGFFTLLGVTGVCLLVSFIDQPTENEELAKLRAAYSSGNYQNWPKPNIDPSIVKGFQDIGVLPDVMHPADNPTNPDKVQLGKMLFYDPRLSSSGQIACASCHDPQLGWGDGKRLAFGHDRKLGKRNAMTLWNVAFYKTLFWDGRANSLEDQAKFPIKDHLEMNESLSNMEAKVKSYKGYEPLFQKAFGKPDINKEQILKAIACFERTIVSPKSRFDLFVSGKKEAITDVELKGLHLYRTKAGCINCHNSPLFSDNQFHNDGQTLWGSKNEDLGLYHVTGNKVDVGKFKTPSLREVTQTGPWFHHGNFPTLKDVIFFYNLGNPAPIQNKYEGTARDSILPQNSPLLKKLNLTDGEIDALLAFLNTITTTPRRIQPPTEFPN